MQLRLRRNGRPRHRGSLARAGNVQGFGGAVCGPCLARSGFLAVLQAIPRLAPLQAGPAMPVRLSATAADAFGRTACRAPRRPGWRMEGCTGQTERRGADLTIMKHVLYEVWPGRSARPGGLAEAAVHLCAALHLCVASMCCSTTRRRLRNQLRSLRV